MIPRRILPLLLALLAESPAVALIGPRQVGKTTLARLIGAGRDADYLDLETPADRERLSDADLYLGEREERLVIVDEVHRAPELFRTLRGSIDRGIARGRRAGRFLLLGSASMDLLRQSGESLAGRISYLDLAPFDPVEVAPAEIDSLWVRGGYPRSFLSSTEPASFRWRQNLIRTYLERDVAAFGPRIPVETLRRLWTMAAHLHGGLLNAADLARGLDVSAVSVARYLDLLVDLLLVRRLRPWHANVSKRLVRAPKVYVRDSGLLHALLGIRTRDELLGHPIVGPSYEGFVVESLINLAPDGTHAHFYRTAMGAEIDLLLELPGGRLWAIEVKRSLAPRPERGFHIACDDVEATDRFVVYPGVERFSIGQGVLATPLLDLRRDLVALSN